MRSSTMAREHAEHFWPWKSEGRLGHAFDGGVDIGVGIDDDRVFAAHFKDGALDPDLAGGLGGGDLVDVQSRLRESR